MVSSNWDAILLDALHHSHDGKYWGPPFYKIKAVGRKKVVRLEEVIGRSRYV